MRFIDEVKVSAVAGNGGNGAVTWRREKYVPKGGPSGGDGGNGGSVIFVADEGMHSLLDFRFKSNLEAQHGEPGRARDQYGHKGEDAVFRVPIGTQIFEVDTDELLFDLTQHEQEEIVCKGGSGGFGNIHFKSATRQAPDFANPGLPGESKGLRLSLKIMADVGLLGFPNAGKSTLLSRISAAKPKIADYPFTTLTPQLGVVQVSDEVNFVMADVPGLIEGASEGAGLGIRFLKHLERVRVLCHLLEPEIYEDNEDILIERYEALRKELTIFNPDFDQLPELIVVTKGDIGNAEDYACVQKFQDYLKEREIKLFFISSVSGSGTRALIHALWAKIQEAKA